MPSDMHILGDMAYPLTEYMMVPYKATRPLSEPQIHFNTVLSKSRVTVERSFGILKGKFRRLQLIENRDLILISKMIVACCILHNVNKLEEDLLMYPPEPPTEEEDDNHNANQEGGSSGIEKRDRICQQIWETRRP